MEIVEAIEKELEGKIPQLTTSIIDRDIDYKYIPNFSVRKTIELGKNSFPAIFNLFPDSVKKRCKKIKPEYKETIGGYDSTEYYGKYKVLSTSLEDAARIYFGKTKKILLSVYSQIGDKNIPKIFEINNDVTIPEYNINIPEKITVASTEKSYNTLDNNIYCLTVNLPYEYYKDIELPDFVASYDVDKQAFWFTGGDINEHQETINSVANNGFLKHIMLKIDGGTIVSAKDYYWAILIAKELKLPTIPVCLYVTIEETSCFERFVSKDIKDKSLISEICYPYFEFR